MLLVAGLLFLLESLLMFELHVSLGFLLLSHAKLLIIFSHHTLVLRMLNYLRLRRHLVFDFVFLTAAAEIAFVHVDVRLVCHALCRILNEVVLVLRARLFIINDLSLVLARLLCGMESG
jgi:hypothetical protein